MRKQGKTPSKEFTEEKKRLGRLEFERRQREADMYNNSLSSTQDEYLSSLNEINQMNKMHGLPQIKFEVKTIKSTYEVGRD